MKHYFRGEIFSQIIKFEIIKSESQFNVTVCAGLPGLRGGAPAERPLGASFAGFIVQMP